MREGDVDHCLNCNERIAVFLLYSGLRWLHERTGLVECPTRTRATPGDDRG